MNHQSKLVAGNASFSSETKFCFGAAAFCAIIGLIGYAINALSTSQSTLSAFLVISGLYLLMGVISLFKKEGSETTIEEASEEQLESAA